MNEPSKPTPLVEQIAREAADKIICPPNDRARAIIRAAIEKATESRDATIVALRNDLAAPYMAALRDIRGSRGTTPRGERSQTVEHQAEAWCRLVAELMCDYGLEHTEPGKVMLEQVQHFLRRKLASGTPADWGPVAGSEPPKEERGEPQEWIIAKRKEGVLLCDIRCKDGTVIIELISEFKAKPIIDAHNAALKAAKYGTPELADRVSDLTLENEQFYKRADKAEHAVGENCRTITRVENELLQAHAAIAKIKQIHMTSGAALALNQIWIVIRNVDLSALEQHDAEVRDAVWSACEDYVEKVRKPLVDALENLKTWVKIGEPRSIINAALANVKEKPNV